MRHSFGRPRRSTLRLPWSDEPSERFNFTETVERYNPESDRWNRRPGLPTGKAWAAATTVDDRALVVGGGLRIANSEYLFLDEIHEADLSP